MSAEIIFGIFLLVGCIGLANIVAPVPSPMALLANAMIALAKPLPRINSAAEAARRASEQAEAAQLNLYR